MDSNQPNWQYNPNSQTAEPSPDNGPSSPLPQSGSADADDAPEATWTAAEYISHERGLNWYLALILGVIVLSAITYLISKDYFATGTIIVLGVIIAIYANRKPQTLNYQLTSSGLRVGDKQYSYRSYRSFSIVREPGISSITLMPLKRFNLPLSAFFSPEDESKITTVLGNHLPYEERQLDGVERLARRLRF